MNQINWYSTEEYEEESLLVLSRREDGQVQFEPLWGQLTLNIEDIKNLRDFLTTHIEEHENGTK